MGSFYQTDRSDWAIRSSSVILLLPVGCALLYFCSFRVQFLMQFSYMYVRVLVCVCVFVALIWWTGLGYSELSPLFLSIVVEHSGSGFVRVLFSSFDAFQHMFVLLPPFFFCRATDRLQGVGNVRRFRGFRRQRTSIPKYSPGRADLIRLHFGPGHRGNTCAWHAFPNAVCGAQTGDCLGDHYVKTPFHAHAAGTSYTQQGRIMLRNP